MLSVRVLPVVQPGAPSLRRGLADASDGSLWSGENILRQRQEVLDVAYQRHPERFVRSAPKPPQLPSEVWINKPVPTPKPLPTLEKRNVSEE